MGKRQFYQGIILQALLYLTLLGLDQTNMALASTTVVAIGGSEGLPSASNTLKLLKTRLSKLDATSTVVIFTGNYSFRAMPAKNHQDRVLVEQQVRAHIHAVEDFHKNGGRVYFLTGHKDAPKGRKKPSPPKKIYPSGARSTVSHRRRTGRYAAP